MVPQDFPCPEDRTARTAVSSASRLRCHTRRGGFAYGSEIQELRLKTELFRRFQVVFMPLRKVFTSFPENFPLRNDVFPGNLPLRKVSTAFAEGFPCEKFPFAENVPVFPESLLLRKVFTAFLKIFPCGNVVMSLLKTERVCPLHPFPAAVPGILTRTLSMSPRTPAHATGDDRNSLFRRHSGGEDKIWAHSFAD